MFFFYLKIFVVQSENLKLLTMEEFFFFTVETHLRTNGFFHTYTSLIDGVHA